MENIEINFPNNRTYSLYLERNTIKKYGLSFPSEINNKTLFVAGIPGTGKSTLVRTINENENIPYFGQTFILLNQRPTLQHCSEPSIFSLRDLVKPKVIDGHFVFPIPNEKKPYSQVHQDVICKSDYNLLNVKPFVFNKDIREKVMFEFRQLEPSLVQEARKKQYEEIIPGHPRFKKSTYTPQTNEEIEKEEYMLYLTAHQLFEQGADVYIRTSFDGDPLRFSK